MAEPQRDDRSVHSARRRSMRGAPEYVGVQVLPAREGHDSVAVAACAAMRRSTASRLRRLPVRVGNSGSAGAPARSSSQGLRTAWVGLVSGTARCLRPLPVHETCAPVPRVRSPQLRLVSSETRSPAWRASTMSARSRRPSSAAGLVPGEGGGFCGGKEADLRLVVAFGRDGQDAADQRRVLGVAQRGVAEQGPDGGQPQVTGPRRVAAPGFEVVEEGGDDLVAEVVQVSSAGCLPAVACT